MTPLTINIKCPACGVILRVTNSKNEYEKRFSCPNCGKHIVVHCKAEGLQILYDENRGRTRVALAEGMDLPDAGRKLRHVLDRFRNRKSVVGELNCTPSSRQ